MGILNNIFGGNGKPTATTQHLAQQLGNALWMTTSYNPHMQQINATALHNPSTWEMVVPLEEQIKELRYILQRTVENYDELQAQYKALQDITKAEENK
jgi:hypothetical protein